MVLVKWRAIYQCTSMEELRAVEGRLNDYRAVEEVSRQINEQALTIDVEYADQEGSA